MRPHGRAHYVRHRYSVSCPVLSLSLSPFPRRTLTTPLSLSLLAIFSSPSLFHSFSPFPCSSFPVFVVRVPFAVRRFARGSRYTHLPPPSRGTFHPPPERGTVARSGRWPRDHVVCISHTLLTYICMRSRGLLSAPTHRMEHARTHTAATAAAAAAASRANTLLSRKIKANTTGERDAGHLAEAFSTGSTLACEFFSRGVDRGEGEDGFFDGILDPSGWGRVWDSSGRWRCEYGEGE